MSTGSEPDVREEAVPVRDASAAPPPRPTASRQPRPSDDDAPLPVESSQAGRLLAESPSWLASLVLHLIILLLLALYPLATLVIETPTLLVEAGDTDLDQFEEVPEVLFDPSQIEEPVEFELQPDTEVFAEEVSFSPFSDAAAAPSFTELSDLALTTAPAAMPTDFRGFDGTGTTGRGQAARTALVRQNGGSQSSEKAVAAALEWIANHQNPDGSWSLVHDRNKCRGRCSNPSNFSAQADGFANTRRSGTGLALLPYLGAGQTHKQGRYRRVVAKGLDALVALGEREKDAPGVSWCDLGNMYAHGIAAIALTEAYGMTRDESLRGPAQAAIDYIIYAQSPKDGGWRYRPKQAGDTSVTGWQIMALKSAYLAGLSVPPVTAKGASKFLDLSQHENGSRYTYTAGQPVTDASDTRSAVGLLCRMYLGWDQQTPALRSGVEQLAKAGPSKNNYYYNYYAAQVLFQYTGGSGRMWREWNREMRDQIVEQQDQVGHAKGSWYLDGPHNERGGRLYMTSLATMSLEVYYRYMPIYQEDAVKGDLTE